MKNTRTKQTPIQRAMKIVTSITLLAMLFVLVLAGTLSGAFGVEENLVQNGKIEGNVASAEGVRTFQTIDLSGTFKNTTDTSININPDVAKRGGLYTTNENHLTNNKWETGNATTGGKWYIADNTNHSGSDYVCAWFVFDLGADYASRVYGDLNISLIGTYTNWNGGGVFAIESGNNLIELPTTTSDGDSTWYSRVRDGNFGVGAKYTKTNELKPKNDKKTEFPISLTHTVSGRYVRIHYATYDPSWNYNEHRFDNVKVTLSRKLAYYVNYDKNSTTATGTVVKSDKLEYFVDNTISNDVYVGNKYYFDHWNTKADNTGVNMAVGATTGTNTNSGFGKVVKDNLQAGITTTTLYAQWNSISFVFNRQTYSVYNGEVLQVLQGHSDYLSSTVSSNYTSTITYKTLSGTSLSSAPTTVGNYIATITVSKGSQTRGAVDLPFAVIEGDFGKLPLGTSGKWGSETNPYVISTPVHLANLSGIVNGTQIALNTIVGSDGGAVTADDVVATDNTYTNCYFVVTADINMSGVDFTPIGRDTSHYFRGLFYGGTNGYTGERVQRTITNLTINDSSLDYVGLFGYVWQNGNQYTRPTIEYITIGNSCSFIGKNCVGSVVAHGQDVTISHCYNYATVTGNDKVGGIVGYNFGATVINGTTNHGAVKGHDYVGGIAGEADWGGLTGTDDAIITNNGTVEGNNYVGGIVGYLWPTYSIVLATNQNQVVGKNYVGGIVGGLKYRNEYNNSIAYSTNTGTIGNTSSSSNIGGILGGCVDNQIDFKIENCSNNGNIDAKNANFVGGVAGSLKGKVTITNCENAYSISGKENVGGLVGSIEGGATITTSNNSGAVNGYKHLGGFVGNAKSSGGALSIEGTSTAPLVNGGKVTSTIPSGSSSANNDGGVAGFVGYLDGDSNLTISHCVNNGEILGLQFNGIAGILGYVKHGANLIYINNCKNTALVEGGINTGGIGGRLSTNSSAVNSMVISNCYNSGEILTQDYSTGSTGNSGTTGGICGYFNATSTTAAARTAVISYCYNVGNVKIVKSTSGQAFAQNDSNKGFIGGIVGNAKSNADNPDTNGKVAIEYCYVDLTSGRSIVRYGFDMTTYINGTNLATVSATSYVIKKGTSITPGNSGSYLLYNEYTTTFDYPLVDGTQTTWENIVTQNINGFRLITNVAAGDYYVSLNGVGGAMLNPANFTSVGSSSFVVEAKYTAEQGNIYLDTADIVLVSKTVTYDKQAHTIDAPTLPSGYAFATLYFTNADAFTDGKGTTSRTDVDDNPYCTETKVLIGDTVVGRMADKNYGTLTIIKLGLRFENTWIDSKYANVIDRTGQNCFVYNAKLQGLSISGIKIFGVDKDGKTVSVPKESIYSISYTEPDQNGEGYVYRTAGTYFRRYTLNNNNYYFVDYADGVVEYKWTIAKNQLTIRNAWTSDAVDNATDVYNFTFNGSAQGILSFDVFAQVDTTGARHSVVAGSVYKIDDSANSAVDVGDYHATLTLLDTANYEIVDSMVESYVATIPAIGSTDKKIDRKGVSVTTNAITYSWKINRFDVGNAFANKKAWFGAGTDMVVANQNTVKTENVNGTRFAYYYLQAAAGDTPKVIVYQNDKYIKDDFVLYVQYTTKTNGAKAHRLVKLAYGTDYEIADLTTAGDKHVADATVTASGTGNFVGNAVKYYVVADSDFGGNVNQANWGSESNPYVIEHESQLLRLSQIVNGGVAWNSINGADGLVANTRAHAANRTYEGCYFVVNANVTLLQSSASGIEGFEPIGSAAYQFKAAQFAKGDGLDSVSIEYSFSDTAREYVGLFGYIDGTSIVGIDVVGKGTIKGNKYVGGIVGYANGGKIEQCKFSVKLLSKDKVSGGDYVGGIVGYANGTAIVRDWNENTYGELMQASVSGVNYVGGIAGEWIVTNANQINGNSYNLSYAANLISVVGTGSYTGGIAGKLDASGCTTDLTYLGFYTNGKAGTGSDDVMDVYGTNYVGALFGAFIGNGYHYDADNLGARSVILVKSLDDIRANVIANGNGVGYVMGGLIGYAEKVGILIGCDWTSESMVKNGSIAKTGVYVDAKGNTSFVGGLVGVLGENATIESVKQEVPVVGGTATISGGQYSVVNKIAINGKDFVGGLIGYIANTAGTYFGASAGETNNIIGNSIKFFNEGSVSGENFVGGIIGGIGVVRYNNPDLTIEYSIAGDTLLNDLLDTDENEKINIAYAPLESDAYTENPFGKIVNVANVTGSGNYVGGLFGYVGSKTRLALVNKQMSDNTADLDNPYACLKGKDTFAVYNGGATIKGSRYVGGFVGFLNTGSHEFGYAVNSAKIVSTASDKAYVGGFVGYMVAGTIYGGMSVAYEKATSTTNAYQGKEYVGGFVGYVVSATIRNSISTGFKFSETSVNKSGIIGNGLSFTIEGSWTIYIAGNVTEKSVSGNTTKGRYLVVDSSIAIADNTAPNLARMAQMVGFNNVGGIENKFNFDVNVPPLGQNNLKNKQLVFYDVSGNDHVSENAFEIFENKNNVLTMQLSMAQADSMIVTLRAVEFSNIPDCKDSNKYNSNAQQGYKKPSASDLYTADVIHSTYNSDGKVIGVWANLYFTANGKSVVVGAYQRDGQIPTVSNKEDAGYIGSFEPGSAESPFIINTQAEWNEFAYSIYTGAKTYSGQYIKLTTDITINNSSHADTNGNNLDFGAVVASVPANGATAPDNLAYNFAGNVHYDNGDKSFQGNFDGNGHTITINYVSGGYYRISVFPNAKNATFKNLTVDGQIMAASQMTGADGIYASAAYDIAGFVGKPFGNLTFTNCINRADIIGLRNIAGIVGYNLGYTIKLESCVNTGNIIGLEGSYTLRGKSKDCSYDDFKNIDWLKSNKAYPYGSGGIIGGTVGSLTIESCRNTGNVTSGYNAGGIIGYSDGTSSSSIATLVIDSCANSGKVVSNSGYWGEDEGNKDGFEGDNSYGVRKNIFGYAGGIVGRTGEYSLLKMFASYNSGEVVTYSNISGGLIGSVGYMGQGSGDKNSVVTPGKSVIAYCYNTGDIKAGGTFPKHTENWTGGRENHGGDIVGGIAGLVGNILITDCYNVGDVYAYGITCYGGSWQLRAGGIVGQADPVSSDQHVDYVNCYNVGTVYARQILNEFAGYNNYDHLRYGGGISGYCDGENNSDQRISAPNCYSKAYAVNVRTANKDQTWEQYKNGTATWYANEKTVNWLYAKVSILGWTVQAADVKYVKTGDICADIASLTSVIRRDGSVGVDGKGWIKLDTKDGGKNSYNTLNGTETTFNLTQSYESINGNLASLNSYPSGWTFVYGCLPQLSVFALDTYNGLSMRSVNYGLNKYGEYERQISGDEFSPYIIKDGVDLLGMQSLVDLGYSFDNKYIEFANNTNNLEKKASKTIDMNDGKYSVTSSLGVLIGKSYHLQSKGSLWTDKNHYYNPVDGSITIGATRNTVNFLPIGRKGGSNIFKGSISGKQADGTNTEVANLRILTSGTDHAFAGLFARAESAEISYITVSGDIRAYAENADGHSAVGGIVADSSGDTIIDHCNAGTAARELKVFAYGKKSAYDENNVSALHTYAGGIVGVATTSFYKNGAHVYESGTASIIRKCEVVNATVKSVKNNIGGIVGYVDGQAGAKGMNNKLEITGNSVTKAELTAIDSDSKISDVGTKVGGILGYSDQYVAVIVSGCTVGTDSTTKSVTIKGENAIGGIVGALPSNINEIKDCSVLQSTSIERGAWGVVENVKDATGDSFNGYGTAIGGIIGYAAFDTTDNTGMSVTTTISGNIVFNGNINIAQPTNKGTENNANNSQDGVVRNVGGVFGDMTSGASFATGAKIQVNGTITIADTINEVRNIGGVAGRTKDVAFSGSFEVGVNIVVPKAYNVGGFIGSNSGIVNVLSDNTTIKIGAHLNGAHDVGGFVGNNRSGAILMLGANIYRSTRYEDPLSINVLDSAQISALADNVGGIVGSNDEGATLTIVKGDIQNAGHIGVRKNANGSDTVSDAVGGIVGSNKGTLATGGGVGAYKALTINNSGSVIGRNYVGGVFGMLHSGSVAGTFTNIGDVTGQLFVGGSIGYVAFDAVITVAGGVATEFKNGAKEDAYTASGDALTAGDTAAQGVGTVKGKAYVGGSIGIMLGKIVGNANAKVVFTSSGIVDASDVAGYLGGSIGVISGQVDYAQFISTGDNMSDIDTITAVGGSVGFIGAPTPLLAGNCTEEYAIDLLNVKIIVVNSHFESNGNVKLIGSSAKIAEAKKNDDGSEKGEFEWGGVGGAIGVIAGVSNGFNGGDDWKDNTYYAEGNITAPGIYNVGGIVGFIRADGIKINNLLAYDITVDGATNVGGIIGSTIGTGTVIEYAFSISSTDGTGLFTASDAGGQAGGIIGKAANDTDASTSYWVKGYKNAELAGTDASRLKDTLGLYTAITEKILNPDGSYTTVIFTKELVGTTAENGSAVTENAIYPTPYDYIDAVGAHVVNGQNVTLEQTYTTDETTGEITKRDWTWYFGEYYTNAEFANDTWVLKKPNWKAYSTGTEQTGWYFVYANDTVTDDIVGTVDAAHKSATATNLKDKDFWKRIANAYTNEERQNGDDVREIYSTIVSSIDADNTVSGGGLLRENNLYATATAANKNKSGFYLYIASSGTSRPTAIHGTNDDKFYIQINTAIDKTTIAKNVAVYYRSIAMGSALTYNGYNRYAPISLQKDIKSEPGITDGKVDLTKKNSYAYTTELVEPQTVAKTVGTYKSNVFVYYYDDTGTAYKVGGITQGAWKIKQRVLTMSTEGTTSAIYGSDNIATTVYVDNIVKEDINNIEFVLSVTGCSNVAIKWGVNNWSDNGVSIDYVGSDKSKDLSGSDANFNTDTIDKTTYKLKFTVKFTNAKNYSLSVVLADKQPGKNYTLNNAEKEVVVKRKELKIKGPVGGSSDNGKDEVTYDGNEHGATWTVDGIVKKTGYNDTISSVFRYFNPQFVVRIRKDPNKDEYLSPASFDLVQKGTATVNKRDIEFGYSDSADTIVFSKAVDAGNYYLAFTNCDDNASNETNYYIKYEQSEDYTPNRPKSKSFTISTNMLTVTWASTSTTHVYDPNKKGVLEAKVVAKEPINDFKTFVEKYFETSWTNLKGTDISISAQSDNKNATIKFTTGENAGTYTANVKVKERTDQDVVNCGCNNATPTKSYKIDRKTITISFLDDGKKTVGSTEYEYNTDVQGLKTILISGLYSGETIKYDVSISSNDAKVPFTTKSYSNVSNSGSADLASRTWIDAGTYTATLTLKTDTTSNNYQLTSNNTSRVTTAQWTITQKEIKINSVSMSNVTYDAQPHKPMFSLSIGTSSTGTYTWHNDTISINYKSGSVDAQAFVNAGKYNVSVAQNAISAKRGSIDTTANYIVDSSSISTISFEIYPRQITLTWDTTITSFVYTGNYSGLKVSDAANEGTHYKVSGATLDSVKISACGNDVITVSLKGKQTEVNQPSSTYKMSYDKHSVTGTNYGEQSAASNYTFGEQSSDPFYITPSILTIKSVGGSTTKVYDANKKVTDISKLTFVVGSSNDGANGENGFFTFEGEYEDKHVGEGKKVTLKFTFTKPTSGNYIVNESELVDNVIVRELAVGSITPKELEVKLDKLRSGKATRVYNGETWYGGANGATYSSGTSARSAVYRSGEGFIVDGFPTAEQNGTVKISAVYKEADAKRGEFDSYVNFVYVDENNVYQKGNYNSKLFKTLVFSISGDCAQNYTFKVTNGTDAYSDTVGKAGQSVTVYDSRDEQNKDKRPANAGIINIEITVKSFKVEYTNTSQSYANSDNTYNTDWKAVEAIKTPTGTTVTVLNGWMYENGENGAMKTYNKYTVIRGRMGSKQLSAQVSGEKGMEHNYNMSNQPILTIGYFVDKTDFEVGSIASLMIASYYWYASQHADSPDFTPIVSAGSEWVSIVTNDVYGTGAFGESNKPADAPKDCNSWDEYFAYIEQKENVTVFLNEYESNSWGYYKTTQTTTKPTYISYRQTADFTGIVKQADIEILNNFFTTYTPGEDGTAIPTQQTWGKDGTYITNFLKPSVGNVLTALGSVFVSTGDGFGGTYNGNGYVIEYLNIYGFGGATQNVGMFDKIGNGSVSGLHLRNVTISANGGNVGGIAGEILAGEASSDVTNVSFHGSITVSGSGNVGGLFGKSARNVEKAIVFGTITANGGSVAGVVGSLSGTLSSVVSLMQVDASGTVAPIANGGTVNDSTYLANAVWSKDGNGKIAYAGGNGTAKSYAELMGGSTSGYGNDKYYYAGDTPNQKGVYDVIDDVALTSIDVQNNSNPRQSMRLRDVVDVYLLMYSLSETTASGGEINGARTYTISITSWLVGDKHGTSKNDAIVIANKQNVALLRQLRFATFVLSVDLTSYEAQSFGGAFYGTIYQNGHSNPTDWLKASFSDVTNAMIVNE